MDELVVGKHILKYILSLLYENGYVEELYGDKDFAELIKLYHDVLYKVLLGIGVAIVTIMGVGFEKKSILYIFVSALLLFIMMIIHIVAKRLIVEYWLCIYELSPQNVTKRAIKRFIRSKKNEDAQIDVFFELIENGKEYDDRELRKCINNSIPLIPRKGVSIQLGIFFMMLFLLGLTIVLWIKYGWTMVGI